MILFCYVRAGRHFQSWTSLLSDNVQCSNNSVPIALAAGVLYWFELLLFERWWWWKDCWQPGFSGPSLLHPETSLPIDPPTKVLIVGLTSEMKATKKFEKQLKKEFGARGVEAVMSVDIMNGSNLNERMTDTEAYSNALAQINQTVHPYDMKNEYGFEKCYCHDSNFNIYFETAKDRQDSGCSLLLHTHISSCNKELISPNWSELPLPF